MSSFLHALSSFRSQDSHKEMQIELLPLQALANFVAQVSDTIFNQIGAQNKTFHELLNKMENNKELDPGKIRFLRADYEKSKNNYFTICGHVELLRKMQQFSDQLPSLSTKHMQLIERTSPGSFQEFEAACDKFSRVRNQMNTALNSDNRDERSNLTQETTEMQNLKAQVKRQLLQLENRSSLCNLSSDDANHVEQEVKSIYAKQLPKSSSSKQSSSSDVEEKKESQSQDVELSRNIQTLLREIQELPLDRAVSYFEKNTKVLQKAVKKLNFLHQEYDTKRPIAMKQNVYPSELKPTPKAEKAFQTLQSLTKLKDELENLLALQSTSIDGIKSTIKYIAPDHSDEIIENAQNLPKMDNLQKEYETLKAAIDKANGYVTSLEKIGVHFSTSESSQQRAVETDPETYPTKSEGDKREAPKATTEDPPSKDKGAVKSITKSQSKKPSPPPILKSGNKGKKGKN
jgi:hypothetical protein